MKRFVQVLLFWSMWLTVAVGHRAFADSNELQKPHTVEQAELDQEIEIYEYHSGVTHGYTLFNFVVDQLQDKASLQENKVSESSKR